MPTSLLWLRRDLRLRDLPALTAACDAAAATGTRGEVLPVYVVDPEVVEASGPARLAAIRDALVGVQEEYDGAIVIRTGDPASVIPALAAEAGACSVHVTGDYTPYGRKRDARVVEALGDDMPMHATGSPYAVTPGSVRKGDGDPFKVFTPFARAWRDHGWDRPEVLPHRLRFAGGVDSEGLGAIPTPAQVHDGGDVARDPLEAWRDFLEGGLASYARDRDRPDLDATSRLSQALAHGRLHPRTLLADIADHPAGRSEGAETFVTELAWREFYADVLWHRPDSAWRDLTRQLDGMAYDDPATDEGVADLVDAWCAGRTGFPIVDAGMRQLLAEGWMHNRVRMITASFLTKDLHVWWPHGARHFLHHLRDGDLASNNHGWQWVAGTGTDASPYFRVFNPITQGEKFDPRGDYVRRWVPELAHVPGKAAHQPWKVADGYAQGYPEPIVDHAEEREESLARYKAVRG